MDYLFQKQQYLKYLARSKILHPHERQKLVFAGAPLVLCFLIVKLEDLTSSCSNFFAKLLYLKCYFKYFPWSKLFHQNERQKLVHDGAPWVLFFLIGKLQNLTNSCWKLFKKLLFLKYYTGLSVLKTRILEIFGKK